MHIRNYSFLLLIYVDNIMLLTNHTNTGVTVGGKILLNLKRSIVDKFSWGLTKKNNNQIEIYGLYLGLTIYQHRGIKDITILGDSYLAISNLRANTPRKDNMLSLLFHCIKDTLRCFSRSPSFHILRILNNEEDLLSNKAFLLEEGQS